MRKPRAFRIEESLIEEAKKKGIDLTSVVEGAIAKVLKDKRCPYCNQKLKEKK